MKSSSSELTEKIVLQNFNLSCHRKAAKMPKQTWAELPPGYARNLNYKHLRWDILLELQRFLPFDSDSSIKFLMKLFSQRDVSSCPAIVKAISRHECFQHIPDTTSLFILDFFYAACLSLRLNCTRDLLAQKSQKFSFISPDMSTPSISVEMKRNHDLICLKKQSPTKLVCHIEGFKFMQLWFLSSLTGEIRRLCESAEIYLFLLESRI